MTKSILAFFKHSSSLCNDKYAVINFYFLVQSHKRRTRCILQIKCNVCNRLPKKKDKIDEKLVKAKGAISNLVQLCWISHQIARAMLFIYVD